MGRYKKRKGIPKRMRKTLFYVCIIFFLCTPVYAFDITLNIKQNIYNNDRLEDATMLTLQLEHNRFLLFASYETPFLRLMGQNTADHKVLGIGIGYDYELNSSLSVQVSPGIYFPNTDVIFNESFKGQYNEGIHRYLNYLYEDLLWDCYDIETGTAIGFNIDLKWEKDIGDFLVGISFGYRYLRIPIKILGWNIGREPGGVYGWWESWEIENLSCAHAGLSFGYKF